MTHTSTSSENEARSSRTVPDEVRALSTSPLLYVGAITVVVATELVELLSLSGPAGAAAVFVAGLALLYGQLAVLTYFGWTESHSSC